MSRALVVVLVVLAVTAPSPLRAQQPAAAAPPVEGGGASCDPLTLREIAAQTVMSGIPGRKVDEATIDLVQRSAGSVVLLGHNIRDAEQLQRLTRRLRRNARARLLVAVDEEGGRVARLGEKGLVDRLPSARDLARAKTPRQVRRITRQLGEQMRDLGVDWNLAPVLDVTDAERDTVIGDRAFSDDAGVVAAHGRAFARGLQEGGVLATAKHFPGHGRTTVDSHRSLPTVSTPLRQLLRRDVHPFAESLHRLDAVMSAHVRYTALDDKRPASLSKAATRLLRERLGYDGILITDSLGMGAITSRWTIPHAAEKALRAGADVALTTDWTKAPKIARRLARAVRDDRLPRARLEQAAGRVLRAKGYRADRVACLLGG